MLLEGSHEMSMCLPELEVQGMISSDVGVTIPESLVSGHRVTGCQESPVLTEQAAENLWGLHDRSGTSSCLGPHWVKGHL